MLLDASLLNTQHYKIQIKDKMSNPGKAVTPFQHFGVVAIKKDYSWQLPYIYIYIYTI